MASEALGPALLDGGDLGTCGKDTVSPSGGTAAEIWARTSVAEVAAVLQAEWRELSGD